MPFDIFNSWALSIEIPVLWVVTTVLFIMGCALADVQDMRFGRALLVVGLSLALCVPLAYVIFQGFDKLHQDRASTFGWWRLLGLVLALLATWIVSAVVFVATRSAPTFKALLAAGFELLLGCLLSALLAGGFFVFLAIRQATTPPPVPAPKVWLTPPTAAFRHAS